jgi:hypothetical protein
MTVSSTVPLPKLLYRAVLDRKQADAGDGEGVDDEAAVQARLADYEAQLAEYKALAEAENDDPDALLAADTVPKP